MILSESMRIRADAPARSRTAFRLIAAVLAFGPALPAAFAAFTYPGCDDAAESQFRYVPVVGRGSSYPTESGNKAPLATDPTLSEPLHMAFDSRPDGKADLYWTERLGSVKRFDASVNTVSLVGTLSGISSTGEMGLTGIALDPAFKTNRRMYLFYANSSPSEFRISRFTLNASGKLDPSAEQVLLRIKRTDENHTGGAMAFDAQGDLWITVGKNAPDYPNSYSETSESHSTEATAANLAELRGGILRIHPDNSARGYAIPEGNFGSYWSDYFKGKGNADLATQYSDTTKVRPELYVKGTRNAYSIAVHPTKRWLAWGEFGVNTADTYTEEHNLVTHPAYGGYPYFAGGFGPGAGTGFYELWSGAGSTYGAAHPGLAQTPAAPVNQSVWNKGPKQLPPATPAMHTYLHPNSGAGAVTGPIYAYDAASPSRIKWPPHFDGAWIITDWSQGSAAAGLRGAKIFKLSATGETLTDSLKWFRNLGWSNPISFEQGADGALYIVNYSGFFSATSGTHIGRLEYAGSCFPTTSAASRPSPSRPEFVFDARGLRIDATGPSRIIIRDAAGKLLFSARQDGPARYPLGDRLAQAGVYLATLETAAGVRSLTLIRP
jgi:cytochrome c